MFAAFTAIKEYIGSYYNTAFRPGYFICIVAMLSVIISINYSYSFAAGNNCCISFLRHYLLYLLPFAISYLLQWFYFKEDRSSFSHRWFWILLLLAPALFAFRVNFNFVETYARTVRAPENSRYYISIINYAVKVFVLMIPVMAIWFYKDRKYITLYGFGSGRNNKLYFLLLALMIPVILLAANTTGFLNHYPKAVRDAGLNTSDNAIKFIVFELVYGLDFLSIEFFFRGFLIIAFIRYCGMRAILPAACFYCCIHLGKPMPEAISSFFGGLLLGIISYNTSSIWGGLIIHIGIAWLMEVAAYCNHYF